MAVSAVTTLASAFKPLLGALVAVAGVKLSFDYLKDAASYAGKVQTLGVTMGVVGENAGYTKKELQGYEDQLKTTGISTEAARDAMIQMMNAGISLGAQMGKTTPQVVEMARAAQDLAVVTGENSSETLQRMVTNIQQLDTEGLRFMGLMVDMTAAQQKFADKLGTSAGALTEAQKRQAVLNEVMQQATKMSGAYELSMETVGKKVGSLSRLVSELSLSIGNKLLPTYGALVDAATDLLKALGKTAEGFDKSGAQGEAFGRGVKALLDPLVPILNKIFEWVGRLALAFGPAFEGASVAIGAVLDVLGDLLTGMGDGLNVIGSLEVTLDLLAGVMYAVADGALVLKAGINALIGLAATATSAILEPIIAVADWLPIPDKFVDQMKGAQKSLDDLSGKSAKSIMEVSDHFMNGQSYIGKWTDELINGKSELAKVDATPAERLKGEIVSLTRAQTDNTMSSQQVAAEYAKLKDKLIQAKDAGELTDKEFARLSVSLGQIEKKMKDELDTAFKTLKTSSSELASGISQDSNTIVGALKAISQNGLATAEQFAQAFAKNLSVAKNVEELTAFSGLLADAKTRWPESTRLFAEAQGQVSLKFDEIYEKQLKALNTSADWDRLKASIVKMGEDGSLSAGQVAVALEKGEQAARRLDPAFVAAAQASDKVKVAVEEVDKQIGKLNDAINITAAQAEKSYTQMATGYTRLADQVKTSTDQQVSDIDSRYKQELRLIDSTATSAANAETRKVQALINAEAEKSSTIEKGYQQQKSYMDKAAEAERAALTAKLASLDQEVAKVEEALGKQKTSRAEYERRMKDLDIERQNAIKDSEDKIRDTKINAMQMLRDRYQAHIDSLISEEERLADRIKSIEEQKAQAKMSTEERIRAIQKSAMGEYEAYQASMSDVAELQAKAREAASRGEFDQAREYLNQAKSAATELNTVVKEGENVIVSKKQAAENAQQALRQVLGTQTELFDAERRGVQASKDAISESVNNTKGKVAELDGEIKKVQETAKTKTELNIQVNNENAKTKIKELDDLVANKERLIPIKADLAQAQQALEKIKADIEAGRTVKVDGDVSKAMSSLENLRQYAEQTNNAKLAMDVSQAMAAIDSTQQAVTNLSSLKATPSVAVDVNGDDKLSNLEKQLGNLKSMGVVDTIAEFQAKNEGKLDDYIYKVTGLDGKTTYSDHTMNIGEAEESAQKIEAIHKQLGTKQTISEHKIGVNDEEAVKRINDAHKAWEDKQTQSKHNIETNSDEAGKKIGEVMKQLPDAESKHNVETNADEQKGKIDEATEAKEVTSQSNVETNADEQKGVIEEALEEKTVTSTHNIETNADETKVTIDAALEEKTVTSTHNITTDADTQKSVIDGALEEKTISSTHNISTDAESQKTLIDGALEEKSVTSTNNIETNASEVKPDIEAALEEKTVTSNHNIETNASEKKPDIESALESKTAESQHNITTNAAEAAQAVQELNNLSTQTNHTITTNASSVMEEIGSLNGRNTYSTHTVYVVKEYLFGFGGMHLIGSLTPPRGRQDVPKVFAAGGPVTPSIPQAKYPRMTGGTIPGAGNYDSVNRMLDVGSFVLRKSAVQKHGAGKLLSLIEKAKTLPKMEPTKANGVAPSILMPGEIVVGKDTVSRLGSGFLSVLNGDVKLPKGEMPQLPLKFADGGIVGATPDFLSATIDLGKVGMAFEKGGPVPQTNPNVIQVDLRSNSNRASVSVPEDQSTNLLDLLTELKSRSM